MVGTVREVVTRLREVVRELRGDELMKEPKSSSGEIERGQARCTMWYL